MNRKGIVLILAIALFVFVAQGISEAAKVYWTDKFACKIQRANLNGTNQEDLVTDKDIKGIEWVRGACSPEDIALDVVGGKMYWVDPNRNVIHRANLDGTNVENIIPKTLYSADSIALDVAGRKMYWGGRLIRCANLDGTNIQTLVRLGLNESPESIALDVSNGKMYWINDLRKIQRANLDGSNIEDLVTGLRWARGIALDVAGGKMYWTDSGTDKIQRANLDGSNIEDLITNGLVTPFQITLDVAARKIYWADADTGKIQRANFDGSNVQDLVTGLEYPVGIALGFGIPGDARSALSPDLIVEPPRVSKSTLSPGESFTLSARVRNSGSAQANSTTLQYYRSSDSRISTSDTEVGTPDSISALGANRSEDESTTLTAPNTPGTYYYGACVDTVNNESRLNNNCSRAIEITVQVIDKPDLVVQLPWVSRTTLVIGESFQFGVTVKNTGKGQAPPTTLRYYLSDDNKITRDDTKIDTDSVGRLGRNGGKSDGSVTLTAPTTAGTYYYGACVDSVSYESNTRNNCSTAFEITVSATDDHANTRDGATTLEVIDVALRGPNRIEVGDDIDYFQLIVKGNGQLTVETTGNLDTRGTLENSSGTALASSDDEGSGRNFKIQHRVTSGTYYLKVESYSNDTGEYTVQANLSTVTLVPDLVVRSPRVSKPVLSAGESFTFSAIVANVGAAESGGTTLRYYRSDNDTISTSDTEVDTDRVGGLGIPLGGRSTSNQSTTLKAPTTPGTYYYGACVESATNENNTDNNCSTAVSITVREAVVLKSDLVVRAPTVDKSTLSPGESFTLSAIVANVGAAESGGTTLRYYRSSDDTISTSDTEVDAGSVGGLGIPLGGRSTSTESITLTAPTTPGTYYYGACVGSVANEGNSKNNCSTAVAVNVVSVNSVVRVTPDSLTQGVGEPVTLKIDIADAQEVIGYNFTLAFDPSVLEYLSWRNGNYLAGVEGHHISVPEAKLTANSVTLGAGNIQDYESTGTGTLAYVTFKVRQQGTSTLALSDVKLTKKGGAIVVYPRVEHGQIIGSGLPPQQNIVRVIYFIPKDRSPQEDIDDKLHDLIQGAQTFYAEQMAEKNGVRKTFTFEADSQGKAVVHHVYGELTNDEYYNNPFSTIKAEIRNVFDTSKNLFFIAADLKSKRIGGTFSETCGLGGVEYSSYDSERQEVAYARGTALIPAAGFVCFQNPNLTYHELGHAFGLLHDFRDSAYTMSYGTLFGDLLEPLGFFESELSRCAAKWLDASPFFNTDPSPITNEKTTIKMLPPSVNLLKTIRFEITDADGLHQVQLIAARTGWKPPPGYPDFTKWWSLDSKKRRYLQACKRLDGVSDTFEFSRDTIRADEVTLQVIDKSGNITRQKFSISLNDDPGDTLPEAISIPLGQRNTGEITTGDDIDFFRIEASSPGVVTAYTTGNLDTVGELQDSSGNVLKKGDDVGDNLNFRIQHRVTAGTYYIKVSSFQKFTGSYTLHANFIADDIVSENLFLYGTRRALGKLQRLNPDGTSEPENLVTISVSNGIVADVRGGKLYWTEPTKNRIMHANLDGSTPEPFISGANFPNLIGLALDTVDSKLYWTVGVGGDGEIWRANLDGSGKPEKFLAKLPHETYLALDTVGRKIYWAENTTFTRRIRYVNMNTANQKHTLVELNPFSQIINEMTLDIAGGKLYWINNHANDFGIYRANLDGSGEPEKFRINVPDLELDSAYAPSAIALDTARGKLYCSYSLVRGQDNPSGLTVRAALNGAGEGEIIVRYNMRNIALSVPEVGGINFLNLDVNRDGVVDAKDLVYISQRYGMTGQNQADVNGDEIVNIDDLILVATAVDNAIAAAPAASARNLQGLTAAMVKRWLTEAELSGNKSPIYQRGIAALEQLLALLMAKEAVPEETSLLPNYPNPFNPETWIPYQLATPTDITLTIYDIHGRVVRTLDLGHQRAGIYHSRSRAAYWDGRNTFGEPVASGVYFYTLTAGNFTATRKMLIRK